jgi:hypothetical protein
MFTLSEAEGLEVKFKVLYHKRQLTMTNDPMTNDPMTN